MIERHVVGQQHLTDEAEGGGDPEAVGRDRVERGDVRRAGRPTERGSGTEVGADPIRENPSEFVVVSRPPVQAHARRPVARRARWAGDGGGGGIAGSARAQRAGSATIVIYDS